MVDNLTTADPLSNATNGSWLDLVRSRFYQDNSLKSIWEANGGPETWKGFTSTPRYLLVLVPPILLFTQPFEQTNVWPTHYVGRPKNKTKQKQGKI